jgi:hypothetical protein
VHSGGDAALVGSYKTQTNGDSKITQTFTPAAGASTLSFWYKTSCQDDVAYGWSTAALTDATTGATTTVLPHTCATDNTWHQVTTPVTAGDSYTLTLVSHDDNDSGNPTSTYYDDVTVS